MTILEALKTTTESIKEWVENKFANVNDAVSQKTQVQILTWEDDD